MTAPAAPPAATPPPAAPPAAPPAFKPPESQEALNEIVETRLARERAKYSDYEDLKAGAARLAQLEADLGSEADKAAAKARDEERAKATPLVVRSAFRAEAKGTLSDEQLAVLLEDLDLTRYANTKGEPDEDKIAKKVAAFAPASGNGAPPAAPPRPLGQGTQPPAVSKPGDQGRAMAEKRFGSKSAT